MWICILHLPRHPKTQSAQFTFFTMNRFWALGLLGFAFRGSGILRTERVTGPSWDHQFAAKQRPIFERAGSEVSRMIPHDFSWSLMISHLSGVRHLARLECPFSFSRSKCRTDIDQMWLEPMLEHACKAAAWRFWMVAAAAKAKTPHCLRDRHGQETYNRMMAREVPGEP